MHAKGTFTGTQTSDIHTHSLCFPKTLEICLQGGYTGYDQSYGSYNTATDQQGGVPAAVANAAQSLPAESQQKLANIVAKVSLLP